MEIIARVGDYGKIEFVLSSIDDDANGLTNTQEQWWCTDPLHPSGKLKADN